jgi:hypothetical protein
MATKISLVLPGLMAFGSVPELLLGVAFKGV